MADPGFIGTTDPVEGGDVRCGRFSVKTYAKMKELGHWGESAPGGPLDPPLVIVHEIYGVPLADPPTPPMEPNSFVFAYILAEKHSCRALATNRVGAPNGKSWIHPCTVTKSYDKNSYQKGHFLNLGQCDTKGSYGLDPRCAREALDHIKSGLIC